MDPAKGGFHAADSWKYDITGAGLLSKSGSGNLTLSGANSWSGGTLLLEGTLAAASSTALGTGDVYLQGGTLAVTSPLQLGGNYTQQGGSTLQLQLGSASAGRLTIGGKATLAGTLEVQSSSGYRPAVGDTLQLLHSAQRHGTFSTVTASGYQVTPLYTATGVQLRVDGKNAS